MKLLSIILVFILCSCSNNVENVENITAQQAHSLISENQNIVVIDVRTSDEFANGHIENAINIDVKQTNFSSKLDTLDHKKTYVIHCRSGRRSSLGLEFIKTKHFKKVYHMTGGILEWQKEKLPLTK